MEKQNYSALSLLTLLPDGKVENDVRITDKTVTGICTVYVKRSDCENEFLLREIGVAAIDGNLDLTKAVKIALESAYNAAIDHIAGITVQSETQQQPLLAQSPNMELSPAAGKSELEKTEISPGNNNISNTESSTDDVIPVNIESNSHSSVDLGNILQSDDSSPDSEHQKAETSEDENGIERIDFDDSLFPASDLVEPAGNNSIAQDDIDSEYRKALDTEITIFGKLHDCNNWKAGKILDERPDVIVDFCQRNSDSYNGSKYTGPRTDRKEALFKLHPDAVRKVQKAA